jgi:serine/threonine-protein kinase
LTDEGGSEALARVGTALNDKWTLERLLGVGGMGAVYAARHRNGARAAIKLLHPDLARHKEVQERFRREGYAANKVDHPGVVKVLDDDVISTGADAGTPYLVMELLEGESLQDRLERGAALGEQDFLQVAERVLDILAAAHGAGVVHRDLKPENLFFARAEDGTERLKVLDFGLARLLQGQTITTYGLALGTPSFMSPEQAAGRIDEIDGRTDLFALAATGFRVRAGRRIHEADDAVELVRQMAKSPAPRLRSVAPDTSEPYARVIDRALEFKRSDRYPSAAAMQADVRRALAELAASPRSRAPSRAAPETPPAREDKARREPTIEISSRDFEPSAPGKPAPGKPAPGMDESVRLPKRRSVLPWIVLLVLGAIGTKLWLDWRRSSSADAAGSASNAAAIDSSGVADAAARAADAGLAKPRPSITHHPGPPRATGSATH